MRAIELGLKIIATTVLRPTRGQRSVLERYTRFTSSDQSIRSGCRRSTLLSSAGALVAAVHWSCPCPSSRPDPGTLSSRRDASAETTPKYDNTCDRGGGTCAVSRERKVIGSITTASLPFRQGLRYRVAEAIDDMAILDTILRRDRRPIAAATST